MASPSRDKRDIFLSTVRAMKGREKFACLTVYDASLARVLEAAGVEVLLVGDSLGMVIQGRESTLAVTLSDMIYHASCVSRVRRRALLMVDMPFMGAATPARALGSAERLMREGGAHIVKIEGGRAIAETVRLLAEHGLPVCAHLGLLPQFVHKLGGYRAQGRDSDAAATLREDARILEEAGADMLLLESIPSALAGEVTRSVRIPVIGIGAGPACDGQVLVLYDVIGVSQRRPRFAHDFLQSETGGVKAAVEAYVRAVKIGAFPAAEHQFS